MATLNPKQQELIGGYLGQEVKVYNPIWKLFGEVNSPYYALTDTILFEDLKSELVQANIIPRDMDIPTIAKGGHIQTAITPELIAGKEPISAMDSIAKVAGVAIVNGKAVDNATYMQDLRLKRLKSGIENTKGTMANELFFNGTFTLPISGDTINFGLDTAVAVTEATDFTKFVTFVATKVRDFYSTTGFVPRVMVGSSIYDKLIAEVDASTGKKGSMDYRMTGSRDTGFKLIIDTLGLEIELFPSMKTYAGVTIDTSLRIQLWAPEALLQAYAGLEFATDDNQLGMLRGEILVDENPANRETGRGSVFAKSAGVPFIVRKDLIQRYNVTLA